MDEEKRESAGKGAGKGTGKAKIVKRVLLALLAVIVVALVGTTAFMMIPLQATSEAQSVMTSDDQTVFLPQGASETDEFEYGLVFYPGAKVEPAAYAPLLQGLANEGWLVVTVDAPAHFMLLNVDAAKDVIAKYPQVKKWYVGGHSLGGVCASTYASNNQDQLAGLILLASEPSEDMEGTKLDVVSIRGSNDEVFSASDAEGAAALLPTNARVYVIEGGNHAQFGNYGTQTGDGVATISSVEQQAETIDLIVSGLPK